MEFIKYVVVRNKDTVRKKKVVVRKKDTVRKNVLIKDIERIIGERGSNTVYKSTPFGGWGGR